MIRFKCPTCQKVLKVLDEGAGRKINCPKCGQQAVVPSGAQPATADQILLGLPVSSAFAGATPFPQAEADSFVHLEIKKDAEREKPDSKPARSWAGTVFALLALMLALAAMPAAVIHHPLLGAGLATLGLTLALFAVLKCLFRRGFGLAMIALMVGGSALFSIVALAGGTASLLQPVKDRLAALRPQDVRQEAGEDAAAQNQPENGVTEPKKESGDRRSDGKSQLKKAANQHTQRDEEQPAQRESAQKQSHEEQKDEKVLPKPADGNTNPAGITFSPPVLLPPPLPPPAARDKPAPKPSPSASLEHLRTATKKLDERLQVAAEKRAAAEREKQRWLLVEQRMRAGEEELREQLAAVPELRLVNDLDVQALHKSAGDQSGRRGGSSPAVMVALHKHMLKVGILEGLPLRAGAQARLQPSAAIVVEQLSKSLRDMGFVSGVPSPGSRRGGIAIAREQTRG